MSSKIAPKQKIRLKIIGAALLGLLYTGDVAVAENSEPGVLGKIAHAEETPDARGQNTPKLPKHILASD